MAVDADQTVALRRIDQIHQTLRTALVCATVAFVAFAGSRALSALAGVQTGLSVQMLGGLHVVLPDALAAAFATWAIGERKLRHRTIRHLERRIVAFETERDPNRTSSGLTATGQTNPKDRR